MDEVVPGIHHWTRMHERIGVLVHSYYVAAARALIDPMEPAEGLDALAQLGEPELIILTNRHHYRHSARIAQRFGCTVHCHEAGLHEFTHGEDVQGFRFGDGLARGIRALEVDAICPEETALLIAAGPGALACADAVIRTPDGALGFVPDFLLGDDPAAVKRAIAAAYGRLLEEDFDALLLAHGEPAATGGKALLRAFVQDHGG